PAGRVVGRHVVREQATARRRDPLELAAELHARDAALAVHRTPLVVRPAGPRTRCQTRIGGHAGKLGVVPEDVELPRGGRVAAEYVALKTNAVHEVSDRCFG